MALMGHRRDLCFIPVSLEISLVSIARKAALLMALRTLVSPNYNTKILGIGHSAKFLNKNI